ncbi:MAG: hypothetical protein WC477_05940 [Patescibacteria group bacterium]
MAYTGDTIRLKCSFYNFAGALANPTGVALKIYDGKRTVITAVASADLTLEGTGIIYYDWTVISTNFDPIVFEYSGSLEGSPILGRSTIEREWV